MAASLSSHGRRRLIRALIRRDGDRCHYCGIELYDGTRSMDHKIPLSAGGDHKQDNLVLACMECNHDKDDMHYDDYLINMRK